MRFLIIEGLVAEMPLCFLNGLNNRSIVEADMVIKSCFISGAIPFENSSHIGKGYLHLLRTNIVHGFPEFFEMVYNLVAILRFWTWLIHSWLDASVQDPNGIFS